MVPPTWSVSPAFTAWLYRGSASGIEMPSLDSAWFLRKWLRSGSVSRELPSFERRPAHRDHRSEFRGVPGRRGFVEDRRIRFVHSREVVGISQQDADFDDIRKRGPTRVQNRLAVLQRLTCLPLDRRTSNAASGDIDTDRARDVDVSACFDALAVQSRARSSIGDDDLSHTSRVSRTSRPVQRVTGRP
jgi:hypothetical protein